MTKISPINTYNINSVKPNHKETKKELYLNLNQNTILSIGTASAALGLIRAGYAFDELKAASKQFPLRGSLIQGAITTAFFAACFALTKIKYGIPNNHQKS